MTHTPRHVKPPAFVKETGRTRQTFYNILKQMKTCGVAPADQKTIDMNCPWMVNWLATDGVGQRKAKPTDSSAPTPQRFTSVQPTPPGVIPDELPDLARLTHVEQYEKVRKMQIDNESKLKNLFARPLVQFLVEHFDDFFIKLIVDGESSLVPKLFEKARVGTVLIDDPDVVPGTVEDCKKIYRQEMSKRIKGVKAKVVKSYKDMVN